VTTAAADLAFLAPGFVHQLGNVFFAMQGQVLQADAAAAGPALQAIAGQLDRGAAALRLLRHVLGDGGPEPAPAGRAVADLADLLRVSVREAGHRYEASVDAPAGRMVDLATFVPATVAALRVVVLALPTGVPALVRVAWSDVDGRLRLSVAPQAGNLPFAFDAVGAAAAWQQRAAAHDWPWRLLGEGTGLCLASTV